MYCTVVLKSPQLLFHHMLCLNTCCLCCSVLKSFCEVWLNGKLHIFQVAVYDPVCACQWVGGAVYLQSESGWIGIYRSEVYPLMKLLSPWLKVVLCPDILLWLDLLVISSHGDLVNRIIYYANASFQVNLNSPFPASNLSCFNET